MGVDDRIFAKGKISTTLIKFAIPAMISLLVSELYNMVDTVFVGRVIGAEAIGGLTVAFPIQRLILALGLMIAVGTSTYAGRSLGEKDYKKVKSTINTAIISTILINVILVVFLYSIKDNMIIRLGGVGNLKTYANEYISIVIFGGLFQCLTVVMCNIMTALGDTKVTLKATSTGAILNIIVDFILVSVFPFGVKGAAIATVASQIVSFMYALYKFRKVKVNIDFNFKPSLDFGILNAIISVGFSTFIIEISDAVVAVILNNLLSIHGGEEAIVIVGVITKVSMFLFITIIGISSAMQPIASYNYGAKNFKRIREVVKKTLIFVSVACTVLWAGMMIFTPQIIKIFVTDQNIVDKAVTAYRIVTMVFPLVSVYYVTIYYYQAMGKAKISIVLSIYRQLIIFIPLVFILVSKLGVMGAWIAFPISDLISAITGFFYLRRALDKNHEIEAKMVKAKLKANAALELNAE